jgi:hypothetical protein
MFGLVSIEMVRAVELERMREASLARVRAEARRERRRLLGPGRTARAWAAFWAPRDSCSSSELRQQTGTRPISPLVVTASRGAKSLGRNVSQW